MTNPATTYQRERPRWQRSLTPLALLALLALLVLAARALPPELTQWPTAWNVGLRGYVDAFQRWVIVNRISHPLFVYGFDPLSAAIDAGMRAVEGALLGAPWLLIVAVAALIGYACSGIKLSALSAVGLLLIGAFGLWEPSMQTLALMGFSVALALLIALPLGMLAAASDRFDRALRPVLDAMQTMPAFVYLVPVLLFFGVARVPAVVATLVYAIPPAIRLTSLGIRQVSPAAVEAAQAFGSTRRQILWRVQLPLALPAIMTGVNQTIMMALSMVVIAAMIGAGGLGREVLLSLQRLKVGQALEAGLAIVILAVVLDRLGEALSRIDLSTGRIRPQPERASWLPERVDAALTAIHARFHAVGLLPAAALARLLPARVAPYVHRSYLLVNSALVVLAILIWNAAAPLGSFPDAWRFSIRGPADAAVAWARDNLFFITGPFSDAVTIYLLNPARDLLVTGLPWPVIVIALAALARRSGGWRLAVFAAVALLAVAGLGMWREAMDTLSQVLVTMLFTVLIAVPLGVLAAQHRWLRDALRPGLDFLQTIPTFVFLVPVIMLFNVGRVPGVIAAVLYAIAPGIKLIDLGVRQVAAETLEAAQAFGSTRAQTVFKVQLPLALPAIMLGINQMIMMVLAMVVISGLVGGAGLGLEAVTGLAKNQPGRGLEAGLAIVLLAIVLDRITQGWARRD